MSAQDEPDDRMKKVLLEALRTPLWPTRRPPLASLPFPSTVARTLIEVEPLPSRPVVYYYVAQHDGEPE